MAEEPNPMDVAAARAAEELKALSDDQLQPLGQWFMEYYRSSGWRRLGRLLKSRMEGDLESTL